MKKVLSLVILLICTCYINVFALEPNTAEVSLNCPSSIKVGVSQKCEVILETNQLEVNSVSFRVEGSNLNLNFTPNNLTNSGTFPNVQINSNSMVNETKTSLKLGDVVVSSTGNYGNQSVTLKNVKINENNTGNVTKTISVVGNNELKDIKIDNVSINNFNSGTYTYNLESTKKDIVISATALDSNSRIDGVGNKSLVDGNNQIKIEVLNASVGKRVYTLNISYSSPKSSNNNLSSIKIDNTLIEGFSKTKLEYTYKTSLKEINVLATAEDSKATIQGNGKCVLRAGINVIPIKVTAENGSVKTYKITVNSTQNLESDNTLKSLELLNGDKKISFIFDPTKTEFDINVDKDVEKVTLNGVLNSRKASFVDKYGNRTVTLKFGSNEVLIKVKAENDLVKTYKLNITKEDTRTDKALLNSLIVNDNMVSLKDNVFEYNVEVNNDVEKSIIKATPVEGAKVSFKDIDLKIGDNTVLIKVTSEKGTVKDYKINIKRLTVEESKVAFEKIIVKDYDINFNKDKMIYELKLPEEVSKLTISLTPESNKVKGTVVGNLDLKDGSTIKINVEDSYGKYTYTINIVKEKVKLFGLVTEEQLAYIVFALGLFCFILSIIKYINVKKA